MGGVDENCFIFVTVLAVAAVAPQSHAATRRQLPGNYSSCEHGATGQIGPCNIALLLDN